MLLSLAIYGFIVVAWLSLIYSVVSMLYASVYDAQAIVKLKGRLKQPYGRWRRYRPPVDVLIAAYNEEPTIERCLESVVKSTYRKLRIIVVDDGSSDQTVAKVMAVAARYPGRDIRLICRLKNGGKGAAIAAGLKRYARGQLLMTLDADCILDPKSITKAVRYFADPQVAALASNVRILPSASLLGLLQRYEYLVGFRSKKFNSAANCEYIVGGAGAMYRRSIFSKVSKNLTNMQTEDIAISLAIARLGNKANRIVYAADVLVHTEHAPTYASLLRQRFRWKLGALQAIYANRRLVFNPGGKYSKTLAWLRLPMALWSEFLLLWEPIFLGLFLYLAIVNQNAAFYFGACVTMLLIMLINIWGDEHLKFSQKLGLSAMAPAVYPLFFVMSSIQVLAMFKVLLKPGLVTGKQAIGGSWVSPLRLGARRA